LHLPSVARVVAPKKEKLKAQKKDYKAYERLASQCEECKEKIASFEQRDVRARQVSQDAPVICN